MLYGQRVGETYEHEGRFVHEVDDDHAYRTDSTGHGLWVVEYGRNTPGGFRESQIRGETQFHAMSAKQFRQRIDRLIN